MFCDCALLVYNCRYHVVMTPTTGLLAADIPEETINSLEKQLLSYSDWSLVGEFSARIYLSAFASLSLTEIET